jgi:hypothetical protein
MLRVFAVLIALRALTDVFKPFSTGARLVFFGVFLGGWLNAIIAPLLGIFMLVYAWGLWNERRFALPMGVAYAIFATINMLAFPIFNSPPERFGYTGYALFVLFGLAVSWGAVWLLSQRKAQLR